MGLLDSVLGAVGGGGANAQLMSAVMGLLNDHGSGAAGLAGLVAKFQKAGLGDVIASWVSTGANLPITPQQLQAVLGSDVVAKLAQQLGLTPADASTQIAKILPQVVDHLTPNGQVPTGALGDVAGLLGRLMGGR